MSSEDGKALVLGRVSGFRGNYGEVTVKVVSGDAARWEHLSRVVLRGAGAGAAAGPRKIESARAYRDRLVLKLAGVDDASVAAALRGCEVLASAEDLPRLPQDVYWVERLVGAQVTDASLGEIGRVVDVIVAGGSDLLLVRNGEGVETLVPMVKEFVNEIDEVSGTIRLTLPEGLLGLNAPGGQGDGVNFDVVTLFPSMFQGPLDDGMLARARRAGRVGVRVHDLRRFGVGAQRQVDDAPFGGGPGMVLKPEPLFSAVAWVRERFPSSNERVVLLSPQGKPFDHASCRRLAAFDRVVLLCGRYEGVDERVRIGLADEEISAGDVVLTGGELPALMIIDAVSRLVPGVLGNSASAEAESFASGLLDFPSYTRPATYRGLSVPQVLLSGDHGAIGRWRGESAREATRQKRPDLIDESSSATASSRRPRGTS